MRRLLVLLIVATALAQQGNEVRQIRQIAPWGKSNTVQIFKFQDEGNDCYVAVRYSWEAGVGISCVKR